MKKNISVLLAVLMLLTFAACNKAPERKEITISGIEVTPKGTSESTQSVYEHEYVKEVWDAKVPNDVETILKAYDEYLKGTFFAEYDEKNPSKEKINGVKTECYLVTNFASKKEVFDNIVKYIDESIIGNSVESCFAEKGGKLYMLSGKNRTALGNVISCDELENGNIEVCVQETSFGSGMEHINALTISDVDGDKKLILIEGEISFG